VECYKAAERRGWIFQIPGKEDSSARERPQAQPTAVNTEPGGVRSNVSKHELDVVDGRARLVALMEAVVEHNSVEPGRSKQLPDRLKRSPVSRRGSPIERYRAPVDQDDGRRDACRLMWSRGIEIERQALTNIARRKQIPPNADIIHPRDTVMNIAF